MGVGEPAISARYAQQRSIAAENDQQVNLPRQGGGGSAGRAGQTGETGGDRLAADSTV